MNIRFCDNHCYTDKGINKGTSQVKTISRERVSQMHDFGVSFFTPIAMYGTDISLNDISKLIMSV